MSDDVAAEYLRDAAASFRKYRVMAEQALSRVTDEEFFAMLDEEANSLAVLVKHMAGNLRSRWTDLLTADGEKPDRHRDGEFEVTTQDSRAALMRAWDAGWAIALDSLQALAPADMARTVRIRGEPHSLVQAINRQLAHAAYHVGQIVLLAKHHRSGQWRSLSIPRGESRQFNASLLHRDASERDTPPS